MFSWSSGEVDESDGDGENDVDLVTELEHLLVNDGIGDPPPHIDDGLEAASSKTFPPPTCCRCFLQMLASSFWGAPVAPLAPFATEVSLVSDGGDVEQADIESSAAADAFDKFKEI